MASIRTCNARAAHRNRRIAQERAKAFHEAQVERMFKSGTLHKLRTTRYAASTVRKDRAFLKLVRCTTVRVAIQCRDRTVRTLAPAAAAMTLAA